MKRFLFSLTVLVLLIVPQFAAGSDLDDFKAFQEQTINAWNSLDAEALIQTTYPGAIILEAANPFPSVVPANWDASGLKAWFETLEYLNISLYNIQYKVVGTTGVSWGFYTITYKPKGGEVESYYNRFTLTAVKADGKWQMLTAHHSAIPTGD